MFRLRLICYCLVLIYALGAWEASVCAEPLQFHVVSANEWLYPDTPIPASPVRSINLHAPRGGRAAFQVL
ncbi:MAG TPA: hypothetical protein PK777_18405, partial [Thermoguttaceae bacterium]|nr:hypothetical protein [Thermoguttaceae bacterium]